MERKCIIRYSSSGLSDQVPVHDKAGPESWVNGSDVGADFKEDGS